MFAADAHNNQLVVVQPLSWIYNELSEHLRNQHYSHLDFTAFRHLHSTLAKLNSFDSNGDRDTGVEELCKPYFPPK